jgi:glucose-6-phosphate isomerase
MTSVGIAEQIRSRDGKRTLISQSVDGCLEARIGAGGLSAAAVGERLRALEGPLSELKAAYHDGSLPHLRVPEATEDLAAAEAAMARLADGATLILFLGTGGSSLGGQTLAQLTGWNIPGAADDAQRHRPRTRFLDNLDAGSLAGALEKIDLATTRFVVTSKSGGTPETLTQALAALGAVRQAGLEARIPDLFLGLTDPAVAGKSNGLRALAAKFGFPVLDHPPGVGGRFSGLTSVGLLPGIARGLDMRAVRQGARAVVDAMLAARGPGDLVPAVGATVAVALAETKGIRVNVMMPYTDRLQRFGAWYVQLWAESLGKNGRGTAPIACLGPLDQHSQLQLFMDGPREHFMTVVRAPSEGAGPKLDADLASIAGIGFMGGRSVGDLVAAQAQAVPEALMRAGRPVRTIDVDRLDPEALGALLMSTMLETILAARLLGVDAFDQPAVELAKTLTRERLAAKT